MLRILVTGATGQLGSEFKVLSKNYRQFEWIFADRRKVSLHDLPLLESQLEEISPDIIINCAAYTAVDRAETEQQSANIINHLAVELIAKFASKKHIKLLHISTDYVFDGNSSVPLTEAVQTNPINMYGSTKRAGEIACLKTNSEAIIIRTSWVYSRFGSNFVNTMTRFMTDRESISVVNDQIGSPTYAADLANAIMSIVTSKKWVPGIYHYSNEGEVSWYEFALAIRQIGSYDCKVISIPSSSYPTPAKRPAYSLLDKTKIKRVYGIQIPDFENSLRICLKEKG